MCQEGIRIGRRTAFNGVNLTAPAGDYAQALKSRPSRLSLILAYAGVNEDPLTRYVLVVLQKGSQSNALGTLNMMSPTLMLDVERHGQLMTGEVWLYGSGDTTEVSVTEVYLNDTLDEAAKK